MAPHRGGRRPEIDADTPFGARAPGWAARTSWRLATARFFSQPWRRRVRKRLARRHAGPFDVEIDGLAMRLYPAENRCDRTVLGRGELPEAAERALIAPLLRDGCVFVDIGANVGVYSLFVAGSTHGTARILAFEPHPRTFAKLDFNCRQNGFERIVRINAGVAGEAATTRLFSDGGGNIGNASLLKSVGKGREETEVRLVTLSSALEDYGIDRIDLLKIDVEGFEDRALMPFFDMAAPARWPVHVLLEIVHGSLWRRDVVAELSALGYRLAARTGENLLLARDGTDNRVDGSAAAVKFGIAAQAADV